MPKSICTRHLYLQALGCNGENGYNFRQPYGITQVFISNQILQQSNNKVITLEYFDDNSLSAVQFYRCFLPLIISNPISFDCFRSAFCLKLMPLTYWPFSSFVVFITVPCMTPLSFAIYTLFSKTKNSLLWAFKIHLINVKYYIVLNTEDQSQTFFFF